MAFGFRLTKLIFNTGQEVSVPPRGLIVLVGPNNAGKTVALHEIASLIEHGSVTPPRVLRDVRFETEGAGEDLEAWLSSHAFRRVRSNGTVVYKRTNVEGEGPSLQAEWASSPDRQPGGFNPAVPRLPVLSGFFVFKGWADNRLGLTHPSGPYDPLNDSPGHPMQALWARRELEEQLSRTSEEAFGTGLTLARAGGTSQLRLHLGSLAPPRSVPDEEYMTALASMPALDEQGDGVRSFMGIMLSLVTSQYPLILIDEPEAFLHPPQARLIGKALAGALPADTQVIVATHDLDVLHGALDAEDAEVSVVRLRRVDDLNTVAILPHGEIRTVWRDPLLGASKALSGLFHPGVVACEADGDSIFYSAALDADRQFRGSGSHGYLFAYSSTKDRLVLISKSLTALEVPCAIVADVDLLREQHKLQALVEALGSDWTPLQPLWNTVNSAVRGLERNPTKAFVEGKVKEVFAASEGPSLSKDEADRIRSAIKVEDGWSQVKRGGLTAIPQGAPSAAASKLVHQLETAGIFIVPVGELERWAPDIAGHGPAFVSRALEDGRHTREPVRLFMRKVDSFLGS